jgi:hypothetical protein
MKIFQRFVATTNSLQKRKNVSLQCFYKKTVYLYLIYLHAVIIVFNQACHGVRKGEGLDIRKSPKICNSRNNYFFLRQSFALEY